MDQATIIKKLFRFSLLILLPSLLVPLATLQKFIHSFCHCFLFLLFARMEKYSCIRAKEIETLPKIVCGVHVIFLFIYCTTPI